MRGGREGRAAVDFERVDGVFEDGVFEDGEHAGVVGVEFTAREWQAKRSLGQKMERE